MTMTRYETLALILLALSLAACDGNQNLPIAPAPAAVPAVASAPLPPHRPLDIKLSTLDAATGQFGHDARQIASALLAENRERGKYETDTQFVARMKALESKALYDELKVSSLIALRANDVRWEYDANNARWKYMVREHPMLYSVDDAVAVNSWKTGNGEAWTTAFPGRKIEEFETVAIDTKGVQFLTGSIPIPPERAPDLENILDVLVIGKLAAPYLRTEKVLPVRDPRDTRVDMVHILKLKIEATWIVNRRTGEVLGKQSRVKR